MTEFRDKSGRFVKGYKASNLPLEYRIKKSKSMSDSWRDRSGYIGDVKKKYPYVYNAWRAILFTDKGKKAGVCDLWRDFKEFAKDVIPTYEQGKTFRRLDTSKPYSPQNFKWCTKDEANVLNGNCITLEYNGEYLTLRELANKYNQSLMGIKSRYYRREIKQYSIEEIIFGRKKKNHSRTPKDYLDSSTKVKAKASKMISSYKASDKRKGYELCDITTDWMIENIITKPCLYCGDTKRVGCDRIDNHRGHTMDNVIPCCYECNIAKGNNFTVEEMLEIGKAIANVKSKREK